MIDRKKNHHSMKESFYSDSFPCLTIYHAHCTQWCSDVGLLLARILKEGVHQLGINQISGVKMIKDVVAAVVSHTAEDSKTGHQDGVVVVPQCSVLD